jgi:hypothetical protein
VAAAVAPATVAVAPALVTVHHAGPLKMLAAHIGRGLATADYDTVRMPRQQAQLAVAPASYQVAQSVQQVQYQTAAPVVYQQPVQYQPSYQAVTASPQSPVLFTPGLFHKRFLH